MVDNAGSLTLNYNGVSLFTHLTEVRTLLAVLGFQSGLVDFGPNWQANATKTPIWHCTPISFWLELLQITCDLS